MSSILQPASESPASKHDLRTEHGPFDIVGDIHGCFDELIELLGKLGYVPSLAGDANGALPLHHPSGRNLIFLGDLVDRGPKIPQVLRLAMDMTRRGTALCVPGNHDINLLRKLQGRDIQVRHGLADSLDQLEKEPREFSTETCQFFESLASHYLLDDGKLVIAHAGIKESMQGSDSAAARKFALYGETTGETDEFGLPVRFNWAAEYQGQSMVVYGHTPVPESTWLNNTINIDTGCVYGGRLTALRYPEKQLVSVPSRRTYVVSARPFLAASAR